LLWFISKRKKKNENTIEHVLNDKETKTRSENHAKKILNHTHFLCTHCFGATQVDTWYHWLFHTIPNCASPGLGVGDDDVRSNL